MMRECPLLVAQSFPCHESSPTGNRSCFSNQQAIAENKIVTTANVVHDWSAVAVHSNAVVHSQDQRLSNVFLFAPTPPTDIFLQTGALLI